MIFSFIGKEGDKDMENCCKNCIWCRWIYLYEEGASPVIDYCEKNECKIEDIEATCWRFERRNEE